MKRKLKGVSFNSWEELFKGLIEILSEISKKEENQLMWMMDVYTPVLSKVLILFYLYRTQSYHIQTLNIGNFAVQKYKMYKWLLLKVWINNHQNLFELSVHLLKTRQFLILCFHLEWKVCNKHWYKLSQNKAITYLSVIKYLREFFFPQTIRKMEIQTIILIIFSFNKLFIKSF